MYQEVMNTPGSFCSNADAFPGWELPKTLSWSAYLANAMNAVLVVFNDGNDFLTFGNDVYDKFCRTLLNQTRSGFLGSIIQRKGPPKSDCSSSSFEVKQLVV